MRLETLVARQQMRLWRHAAQVTYGSTANVAAGTEAKLWLNKQLCKDVYANAVEKPEYLEKKTSPAIRKQNTDFLS